MIVHVVYPHSEPQLVFRDGDDEVWFGQGTVVADHVVWTATANHHPSIDGATLLCLEPPIVEPHAYSLGYRRLFSKVVAFAGVGTTHRFLNVLPPLWPKLPSVVRTVPWASRADRIVAVMGNKYPHRIQDLEWLVSSARRFGVGVDIYGRPGFHGTALEEHYGGEVEDKHSLLAGYRYCYCPENQSVVGYLTEKLPEAIFAGCFPIYNPGIPDQESFGEIPWQWVHTTLNFVPRTSEEHATFLRIASNAAPRIREKMDTDRLWRLLLKVAKEESCLKRKN